MLEMLDYVCLIVGQPFRVADDFEILKHCPTKKSPLSPLLERGE